jgi:hypothetical protein
MAETILQSKTVKCQARGVRFVSGIASRYDDTYPSELEGYISGLTKNILDLDSRSGQRRTSRKILIELMKQLQNFGHARCATSLDLLVPH